MVPLQNTRDPCYTEQQGFCDRMLGSLLLETKARDVVIERTSGFLSHSARVPFTEQTRVHATKYQGFNHRTLRYLLQTPVQGSFSRTSESRGCSIGFWLQVIPGLLL
jgi:hypothetical protein